MSNSTCTCAATILVWATCLESEQRLRLKRSEGDLLQWPQGDHGHVEGMFDYFSFGDWKLQFHQVQTTRHMYLDLDLFLKSDVYIYIINHRILYILSLHIWPVSLLTSCCRWGAILTCAFCELGTMTQTCPRAPDLPGDHCRNRRITPKKPESKYLLNIC